MIAHKIPKVNHGDFDYDKVGIYLVGGAVRDLLMGMEPSDYDYVVVGSSPEEMLSLGFKQVGKSFPVFIHPETKCEYALARTETKTGEGHADFTTETYGVTLTEDLSRRDITINAIAVDVSQYFGEIIDPFNGIRDLSHKIIRHVSDAFKDDPLRVLRVARFLAKFGIGNGWHMSADTEVMCHEVAAEGGLHSLSADRIWMEIEKVFNGNNPSDFFDTMNNFSAIFEDVYFMMDTPQRLDHHPEGDVWTHTAMVMDLVAMERGTPQMVFAAFTHDFGKPISWDINENAHEHEEYGISVIENFCRKWRVPNVFRDFALMTCKHHTKVHGIMGRDANNWTRPKSIHKLFHECDAFKQPDRFKNMLTVCEADARGRGKTEEEIEMYLTKPYPQKRYLLECLAAVLTIDTKMLTSNLIANGTKGKHIGEKIRVEQINAIRKVQDEWKQRGK